LRIALDDATNKVAERQGKILAELQAAKDANQAPKQETLDAIAADIDRLKALGSDPAAPIPAPEPPPAA
jgi:hypothetical protein